MYLKDGVLDADEREALNEEFSGYGARLCTMDRFLSLTPDIPSNQRDYLEFTLTAAGLTLAYDSIASLLDVLN
jgi:hypothetical protein